MSFNLGSAALDSVRKTHESLDRMIGQASVIADAISSCHVGLDLADDIQEAMPRIDDRLFYHFQTLRFASGVGAWG